MKKILNFVLIFIGIGIGIAIGGISFYDAGIKDAQENTYRNSYVLPGIIRYIREGKTVIEDRNGNLWTIDSVYGDEIEKPVTVLFNTNGTNDIKDDIVIQVAY